MWIKMKRKLILVFGTRPEAIKMCPLVKELKNRDCFQVVVCVTGQHKEMLAQVLESFRIEPDHNLEIMEKGQTLFDITEKVLKGMKEIYEEERPDMVLVHGDTGTAFASALAAFYAGIPIGHVEAGLRTYDISAPYPEEFNRQAIGSMAYFHFSPTKAAAGHLIREGKKEERIFVTGNTAIDALNTTVSPDHFSPALEEIDRWKEGGRLILLTAHRRENLGKPLYEIFQGIRDVLLEHTDLKMVYPVHYNPAVREAAKKVFADMDRVRLIEPMEVVDFHNLMERSFLILTDSGGIQEEAPALGKPVLVLRDTTERPEGIEAGTLRLAGTKRENIYREFKLLVENHEIYDKMSQAANPYGDGTASRQIADILERLW